MRTIAWILIGLAACGGKREEAARGSGSAAGNAAADNPAAAHGNAAAAPIDAAAPPPDARPIDAPARTAPAGAFVLVVPDVAGRPVLAAPGGAAALESLAGARLELRDEDGRACDATVGAMLPRAACRDSSAAVAELLDPSESCASAFYGVARGAALATTKVGRATPAGATGHRVDAHPAEAPARGAIEAAAEKAFDEGTGRMAMEKQALEGLDRGAEVLSTRVLRRDGAGALVLLYSLVHGHRTIDVYQLATDEPPTVRELASLRAPAPSRVIGADVDGDGLLDALIAHDAGVAVVHGSGDAFELGCERPE